VSVVSKEVQSGDFGAQTNESQNQSNSGKVALILR
jgi:hypothetical protein